MKRRRPSRKELQRKRAHPKMVSEPDRSGISEVSLEEKLRQLAEVLAEASPGRTPQEIAEKAEVLERWMRLRKAYGVL